MARARDPGSPDWLLCRRSRPATIFWIHAALSSFSRFRCLAVSPSSALWRHIFYPTPEENIHISEFVYCIVLVECLVEYLTSLVSLSMNGSSDPLHFVFLASLVPFYKFMLPYSMGKIVTLTKSYTKKSVYKKTKPLLGTA